MHEYTFHYMSVNSARFMLFQKFELNSNFGLSNIFQSASKYCQPSLSVGRHN